MARARKRHEQQALRFASPGRRRKNKRRPGSKEPGRPRKPHAVPHVEREHFGTLRAAHVTLRLVRGYESLRQRQAFDVLKIATAAVSKRSDFRIVHISIELDHVHLVVEAETDVALANGVRAFQISAAQRLNRAIGRQRGERVRGKVFAERYHVRFIGSPTQARNTINYVLNNWRRHSQDEAGIEVRYWDIDYMSSAISFDGWAELEQPSFVFRYRIPVEDRLCVSLPHSWLLSKGWRKAGAISMYAVPGPIQPPKPRRRAPSKPTQRVASSRRRPQSAI